MDEVIEAILNDVAKKTEGFPPSEQAFIFTELSERLAGLTHEALMTEYGLREEDYE